MLGPTGPVTVVPAAVLIERVLPSKLSTVPRTMVKPGLGAVAGASAAEAAAANATASAAAASETRMDFPPEKGAQSTPTSTGPQVAPLPISFSLVSDRVNWAYEVTL